VIVCLILTAQLTRQGRYAITDPTMALMAYLSKFGLRIEDDFAKGFES